jgi:hypothetical protein
LGPEFKDLKLSPTACRVVWLAQHLPNKFTRICMDIREAEHRTLKSQCIGSWCCTDKRAWNTDSNHSEGENKQRMCR